MQNQSDGKEAGSYFSFSLFILEVMFFCYKHFSFSVEHLESTSDFVVLTTGLVSPGLISYIISV